jgi:hypothetical protein
MTLPRTANQLVICVSRTAGRSRNLGLPSAEATWPHCGRLIAQMCNDPSDLETTVRPTRLVLASIAAGGALALGLAVPAAADPVGCNDLNSGAHGLTCTRVGSNLYPGIAAHVGLPPVHVDARLGLNPATCDNVTGLLTQARLAVRIDAKAFATDRAAAAQAHKDLVAAEKADRGAQATRDAAVASAQTVYLAEVAAAPVDNPATVAVNEHQVALDNALAKRNTAVANANSAYQAGGTAAALKTARANANAADDRCAADQRTSDADAVLVVNLGAELSKCQTPTPVPCNCTTTNPVPLPAPDVPVPPDVVNPAPIVVNPTPVIINNPQVGIVPQGPAQTGAVSSSDRYTG